MDIGKVIREMKRDAGRLGDEVEVVPVRPGKAEGCVTATDGGLVVRKYSLMDVIYYRAVSAVFRNGTVRFHPERFVKPKTVPSAGGNTKKHAALLRVHEELSELLSVLEDEKPGLALLDGSLFPHPSLRTEKWKSLYSEVLSLYDGARRENVAGVIKDARSRELAKTISSPFRDISLLHFIMEPGSMVIAGEKEGVTVFYLKIGSDFPLRVETAGRAERVAAHLLATNTPYVNLPREIIYADRAARISRHEIRAMEGMISSMPEMKRRRDRKL